MDEMNEKASGLVDESVQKENWKDRLIFEYTFVKDKQVKLGTVLEAVLDGKVDATIDCPVEILLAQYHAMSSYLACLEIRAKLAGIDEEPSDPEVTD